MSMCGDSIKNIKRGMNNTNGIILKIIRILTYLWSISNTENVLAVYLIQMRCCGVSQRLCMETMLIKVKS